MTILIANIGTSDLAVNVEGYYLPIRFDRNEPNLDESQLTEEEKIVWDQEYRQSDVIDKLCPELGVETNPEGREKFFFRDFTEKLWAAYEQDEEKWHSRISPGRLQGVVSTAKNQFQARSAFIFATDQPQEQKDDSIYLFKILKKWFWREMEFELIPKYIPSDTDDFAVNLDQLLDFYYRFFHELDSQEEILVSIKGGTPQMQNALRLQAVSSTIPKQLFVEPKLSVKNILAGQPSQCQLTAYWKYMRNQKYQTVQQLLDRWDFDGAINILKSWHSILTFLDNKDVLRKGEIKQSRKRLDLVIAGLSIARSLFNLDIKGGRSIINDDKTDQSSLNQYFRFSDFLDEENYDSLLNLYTQCCIYYELSQTANFLARVGSFYENAIIRLIEKRGGYQYLDQWKINVNQLQNKIGNPLLQEFQKLEGKDSLENSYSIKFSRYSKRNYLDILIKHRAQTNSNLQSDLDNWNQHQFQFSGKTFNGVLGLLKALDYWIEKRNDLVHNAEGLSQVRINDFNRDRPQEACTYDDIIPILTEILKNSLVALNRNYRQEFVENNHYYIYSNAKESAIALLMTDTSDN